MYKIKIKNKKLDTSQIIFPQMGALCLLVLGVQQTNFDCRKWVLNIKDERQDTNTLDFQRHPHLTTWENGRRNDQKLKSMPTKLS